MDPIAPHPYAPLPEPPALLVVQLSVHSVVRQERAADEGTTQLLVRLRQGGKYLPIWGSLTPSIYGQSGGVWWELSP